MSLYVEADYYGSNYTADNLYVNWGSKNIFIPRDSMLLVQSNPVEIRQIDLTDLHLQLRDEEESVLGMTNPATHKYNSSVTISGVSLAQVVEILEPYTITFEDGSYNVNIIGGNSNVSDRVVKNTVGVNTANSAGLQDSESLQAASFSGDAVALDVVNGTAGTTFPIGTRGTPSSNWADAIAIATKRNLDSILILGTVPLGAGVNVSGKKIRGSNPLTSILVVDAASITDNVLIEDVYFTGALDGGVTLVNCVLGDILYIDGYVRECAIASDSIAINGTATFFDCAEGSKIINEPVLDMTNGDNLFVRRYGGDLTISNKVTAGIIEVGINGRLTIDASCTNGTFRIFGNGKVVNNSGLTIIDNTSGSPDEIVDKVWNATTRELTSATQSSLTQEQQDQLLAASKAATKNDVIIAQFIKD